MTDLNIDLLRECVEWAEKEEARGPFDSHWNQGGWATPMRAVLESRGLEVEQDDAPVCGTAYCIAGYAAAVSGMTLPKHPDCLDYSMVAAKLPDVQSTFSEVGAALLGIDEVEARTLFDGANTLERVKRIAAEIASAHGHVL